MMHLFNTNVAMKYGIHCAILLQHIFYWVEKNKANNINCYEGMHWTHNSNKAFQKMFPYMTEKQIRYALDSLKDNGLILTGYHGKGCDRTLSYTITEKGFNILNNIEISNEEPEETTSDEFLPPKEEKQLEEAKTSENIASENALTAIEEEKDEELPVSDEVPFAKTDNKHLPNSTISICHTGQMDSPSVANDINKKPQIKTKNNIEKEIHKEKENTEDPVVSVFDFWNSKNLLQCEELTESLRNIINSLLKTYKLEEIKLYISRYDEALNNEQHYLKHKWSLKSFLCQPNAMSGFKDNGEKWINYLEDIKSKQNCNSSAKDSFIHNNYTKEQIASLVTNLDEAEV